MSATQQNTSGPKRIVVGVDGSASSKAALAWAARQAKLTGTPLVVVVTWEFPTSYGWPYQLPADLDLAGDAAAMLGATVSEVLGPHAGVDLSSAVVEGHPAPTLVEESKTASLVVVGSRGHGEFAGMLLGSVSEFLTTHAHCPVVVVRDDGGEQQPS
ncbi:MAG TPA: universal stress protein [Acidimicrobiales bacterium]|nr:universal stress protein [Acidimicrobiales bacterium]